jgi:hypothetical protein
MNTVKLSQSVIDEIKRIIVESEVTKEDDRNWPEPDKIGRQELEIKLNKEHISFTVSIKYFLCEITPYLKPRHNSTSLSYLPGFENWIASQCARKSRPGRLPHFLLFSAGS